MCEVIGIFVGYFDVQNVLKCVVIDDWVLYFDGVGILGGIDCDVIGDFEQFDCCICVCGYCGVGDCYWLVFFVEIGLCLNNWQIGCQLFGEFVVELVGRKFVGV